MFLKRRNPRNVLRDPSTLSLRRLPTLRGLGQAGFYPLYNQQGPSTLNLQSSEPLTGGTGGTNAPRRITPPTRHSTGMECPAQTNTSRPKCPCQRSTYCEPPKAAGALREYLEEKIPLPVPKGTRHVCQHSGLLIWSKKEAWHFVLSPFPS